MIKKKGIHICVLNRNIGDNALNLSIRKLLEPYVKLKHMELLNNDFDRRTIKKLNKTRIIIFGGGGLIHSFGPRGNSWERTGTMWNIRLSDLANIESQIVLYGVGLNHFYNEPDPSNQMKKFFEILFEKKAIISFRNDGSMDRFLRIYPEFKNEIFYEIPDPGVFFRPKKKVSKESYAILQIAADRKNLRYGDKFDVFLEFITRIIKQCGRLIYLIPHTIDDQRLFAEIKHLLPVKVLPIENSWRKAKSVIRWYQGADFTIATRGHSQICSVGNQIPTFSIATHPKIEGFAKACGIHEHCYNFHQESLNAGYDKFDSFINAINNIRTHLIEINQKFDQQINNFNRNVINAKI